VRITEIIAAKRAMPISPTGQLPVAVALDDPRLNDQPPVRLFDPRIRIRATAVKRRRKAWPLRSMDIAGTMGFGSQLRFGWDVDLKSYHVDVRTCSCRSATRLFKCASPGDIARCLWVTNLCTTDFLPFSAVQLFALLGDVYHTMFFGICLDDLAAVNHRHRWVCWLAIRAAKLECW